MENIKAIFLDWNGTLSDSLFWEHLKLSSKLDERKLFAKLNDAMFNDTKKEINDWMRGHSTTEKMVSKVCMKTETDFDFILDEFIESAKSMYFFSDAIPLIINRLREKSIKVFIATNNMDSFTRWTVPSMSLVTLFDGVINSYDQKGLKHDIDNEGESIFFNGVFKKFSINPREAIFIDDGIDKNGFISKLGIKFIQIENSSKLPELLNSLLTTHP